jgi:hypothetical protein
LNANLPIYKIGKTEQENIRRFSQYPKGSLLLIQTKVQDCNIAEKELISIFKNKFKWRKEYGYEYFEGSLEEMKNIINAYTIIMNSKIDNHKSRDKKTKNKSNYINEQKNDEYPKEIKTSDHIEKKEPIIQMDTVKKRRSDYLCLICNKSFVKMKDYLEHTARTNDCNTYNTTTCFFCNSQFGSTKYLRNHLLHYCDIRHKKFNITGPIVRIKKNKRNNQDKLDNQDSQVNQTYLHKKMDDIEELKQDNTDESYISDTLNPSDDGEIYNEDNSIINTKKKYTNYDRLVLPGIEEYLKYNDTYYKSHTIDIIRALVCHSVDITKKLGQLEQQIELLKKEHELLKKAH